MAEAIRGVASQGAEVMIATHNQASVERALGVMQSLGLAHDSGVCFGQLLGMADHLTFMLGQHGYRVSLGAAGCGCYGSWVQLCY